MDQQALQKTAGAPETAQQHYEEGLVLLKHKHYADALSCFERVIELGANHAEAWYRIGCCRSEIAKQKIESVEERLCAYEEFELYKGAIEAYQKAIELQPDYTCARRFLQNCSPILGRCNPKTQSIHLTECGLSNGINRPSKFAPISPIPTTNWPGHTRY